MDSIRPSGPTAAVSKWAENCPPGIRTWTFYRHGRLSRRRLPPYARRVRDALNDPASWRERPGTSADGQHPTVLIVVGPDAWETTRRYIRAGWIALLVPPGEDPANYDWSLVAEFDPILILRAGPVIAAAIIAVAVALMRDGSARVLDAFTGTRYLKEMTNAT